MTTVTIQMQQRGVLVLPKKIRDLFALDAGSVLKVRATDEGITISPQMPVDPVLLDIRKGLEDIKRGDYIEFSTIDEFHEKVKQYAD